MTKQELDRWWELQDQYANTPEEVDRCDYQELIRLNHIVMALANNVHNDNMMNWRSK